MNHTRSRCRHCRKTYYYDKDKSQCLKLRSSIFNSEIYCSPFCKVEHEINQDIKNRITIDRRDRRLRKIFWSQVFNTFKDTTKDKTTN